VFWGIWWPFVILSMLVLGRLWCGVFCPEGSLTEWTSKKFGLNKKIPRWIKWKGWPTAGFMLITLYGQLVSVYDYAKPALLILGGSTVFAMIIGWLYGRGSRVWCKDLCPVSGVFNLLSRLAPFTFKADEKAWQAYGKKAGNPNCPPMINIRQLHGVSNCHMCGRCADYRHAVQLMPRSVNEEVVRFGDEKLSVYEFILLLYGMVGVGIGAFTWTVSPWFIALKQKLAVWLVGHDIFWPLNEVGFWWILTDYPQDAFNWIDGFCIASYILGSGIIFGSFLTVILWCVRFLSGKQPKIMQHLAQVYLPLAAAGLFLGLTSTTIKLLQYEFIFFSWLGTVRALILVGAFIWSMILSVGVLGRYEFRFNYKLLAFMLILASFIPIVTAWYLMYWGW